MIHDAWWLVGQIPILDNELKLIDSSALFIQAGSQALTKKDE
jgi:hypothetical protein